MRRVIVSFLLLLFLLPLVILLISLLGSSWVYPSLIPTGKGLSPIISSVIRDILPDIISSLFYGILTVFMTVLISLSPAKWIAYSDFYGKSTLETVLLLPAVISPFTFLMGIQFLVLKIGWEDSFFSVILILTIVSYPYMLRALISAYSQTDRNIFVCAKNLGSSPLRTLLTLDLPLLLPGLIAGANIVFLVAFSDYFLVFIMGGTRVPSLALRIFPLISSSSRQITSFYNIFFLIVPLILFSIMDVFLLSFMKRRNLTH